MNVNRRSFLGGAGGFAGACLLPSVSGAAEHDDEVRFLAFADIHYAQSGFWPHGDIAWLDRVLGRAVDANTDFVVSLGDMSFNLVKDKAYIDHYNNFKGVKTFQVVGNHEFENCTFRQVAEAYRLERGYHSWDVKGFRFIALDPHYHAKAYGERLEHFDHRCSYPEEKVCYVIPPDQVAWLKEAIRTAPGPCVVFSHESIERIRSGIRNRKEILAIFNEANRACPGKVRLVVNGHEHKDNLRILDGVVYLDLNSATYDIGRDHQAYPEAFRKRCGAAKCILTWNAPLSAVITMSKSGLLRLEGTESSYYLGVTPEMAGWSGDADGRVTVPEIQSVNLQLNYPK